jgi:hypothetical protein
MCLQKTRAATRVYGPLRGWLPLRAAPDPRACIARFAPAARRLLELDVRARKGLENSRP